MPAVNVQDVTHSYGERVALNGVSLSVAAGEIFGLLGPNGGGKSTLFRLLATLLPLQTGAAEIAGFSVSSQPAEVRRLIGVTFQSPSLDPKLTIRENLVCQGLLYGLTGQELQRRIAELSEALGVSDRMQQRAETLSGGLKRRVEVAKSLLHEPQVLLLDEPSTGLDPGIRHDLWKTLRLLVEKRGLTILVTTHLLDEAEHCSRLAILDQGQIVASGRPHELRSSVGGDCITIQADDLDQLAVDLRQHLQVESRRIDDALRIEQANGHLLVRELMDRFGDRIRSVTLGRPTLEDVFIRHTGRRLEDGEEERVTRRPSRR